VWHGCPRPCVLITSSQKSFRNSIANGLAGLRNAFGDAHGKSAKIPKPTQRHADLSVNAAGTIATFLIATYKERNSSS
jgi:hypothetical protein